MPHDLMEASREWATRPDDERYASLEELHDAMTAVRDRAATAMVPWAELHAIAQDGAVMLNGRTDRTAELTHWSFGRLASIASAPAEYLRTLPAELAATCINHGIRATNVYESSNAALLFAKGDGDRLTCRALATPDYSRIWCADITSRLLRLRDRGWRVPPARPAHDGQRGIRPATAADVLDGAAWELSIKEGDLIAPAGLYAGDRDMFVFMVNQSRPINDGAGRPLNRGFFCRNDEVRSGSLTFTAYTFDRVCGNHIVWDARDVVKFSVRHVGTRAEGRAWYAFASELDAYTEASAVKEEGRILAARRFILGATKEEALDRLFGLRQPELSRARIGTALELAERREDRYGEPRSVWAVANCLTELSQRTGYTDQRAAIDRAAGKVLALAF